MQKLTSGLKPVLKTKVKKIGGYDVIFVGTPIWWGTIATPVKSFLSEYELSGKPLSRLLLTREAFSGEAFPIYRNFVRIQPFWMALTFGGKMQKLHKTMY